MYFCVQRSQIPFINPPFFSSSSGSCFAVWLGVSLTHSPGRVRQNAWCCTSLQTALTRPPAGLPADCRIEKASRVELSWEERGREAENDQRQMSNVILCYSVVGLKDGGVALRETLAGGSTIRHRCLCFILQLYSCQMLQKRGALRSRPVLCIVWKASFQWRDVYVFLGCDLR